MEHNVPLKAVQALKEWIRTYIGNPHQLTREDAEFLSQIRSEIDRLFVSQPFPSRTEISIGEEANASIFSAHVQEGIIVLDRNWLITHVNYQSKQGDSFSPQGLVGKNIRDVWPEISGASLDSQIRQAMDEQSHTHLDLNLPIRDAWYRLNLFPSPNGVVILFTDETAQKRAEIEYQSLLEENQRQKNLLEAVFNADPSGVAVLVGPELRFVYSNPVYRFITPDPRIDPVGKTYQQIWPTSSRYASPERFLQVLETGIPFQHTGIEFEFLDGQKRIFSLQSRRMEWDNQLACLVILWDVTEQMKAEEALRSTALFPEQSPNIIFRVRGDGSTLYVNPACRKFIPDLKPGKPAPEYWHTIAQDALRIGEDRKVSYITQDRVFEFHIVPIPDNGYVNLYGRDITEHERAQISLQESEERFRAIAETTPVGIGVVSILDSAFLYTNEAFDDTFGYRHGELIGKGIQEVDIYWDTQDRDRLLEGLIRYGTVSNDEIKLKKKDSTLFWGMVSIRSITFNGKPAILGVFVDITARIEAERAYWESEARLQEQYMEANAAFEAMSDAMILFDREGRIVRVNRAANEALGFDILKNQQKALTKLQSIRTMDGQPIKPEALPNSRALRGEKLAAESYQYTRRSGGLGYILISASPIFTADGDLNGAIVVWHDVTERWEAEMQANRMAGEFEVHHRLIEQREQERLQIARDLHDGPVQALSGVIFALRELSIVPGSSEVSKKIGDIQSTLQEQVNELRAYAGHLRPPTLANFGLVRAIQSHLDEFQEKHPSIGLELEAEPSAQPLPPEMNLALFRIYQEGLVNIHKHSNANRVKIRLSQTPAQVLLEIWDNGRGFEVPEDWLLLARAGHLGLVGMRERAEAIGGTLSLHSSVGEGTIVQVVVPL